MSQPTKGGAVTLLAEVIAKEVLVPIEKGECLDEAKVANSSEGHPTEESKGCEPPTKKFKAPKETADLTSSDETLHSLPPFLALPSIASLVSDQETEISHKSVGAGSCPLPPLSEPTKQAAQQGVSVTDSQSGQQNEQKPQTPHSCSQQKSAQPQDAKPSDSLVKLGCRGSMLISDLKRHIEAKTGILFDHQMLIFNGQRLCDTSTLHDVGIDKESIVHLVVQVRKPSAVPHTPSEHSHSLNDTQ